MTTHAVGHREQAQPDLDEEAVLVAVAHLADVGGRADDELHLTTRITRLAELHGVALADRAVVFVIRSPFTNVPLVEPRSST